MIRVFNMGAKSAPFFVCDVCDDRIENAGLAAAVFPRSDREGDALQVMHVHKGECHDQAEAKLGGGKGAPWHELQDHLRYLVANTGKSLDDLKQRGDDLGEFGVD